MDTEATINIYTDGCMNKDTKDEAWASVTDSKSVDLVESHKHLFSDLTLKQVTTKKGNFTVAIAKFTDVTTQQNNGAELMAFIMGLRIALSKKETCSIFSDSQLIVEWWSKGKVNKQTWSKMDQRKKDLIDECKTLRASFEENGGKISHIPGAKNPADLGYHK